MPLSTSGHAIWSHVGQLLYVTDSRVNINVKSKVSMSGRVDVKFRNVAPLGIARSSLKKEYSRSTQLYVLCTSDVYFTTIIGLLSPTDEGCNCNSMASSCLHNCAWISSRVPHVVTPRYFLISGILRPPATGLCLSTTCFFQSLFVEHVGF